MTGVNWNIQIGGLIGRYRLNLVGAFCSFFVGSITIMGINRDNYSCTRVL